MSSFTVRLLSAGDNKMAVITAVREVTRLGLPEAIDLVNRLGIVAEDLSRRAAEKIQDKLASAGAKSSIQQTGVPELEPDPVPKPKPTENMGGSLYRVPLMCVVAEKLTRTAAEKMKEKLEAVGIEVGIEEMIDPQPVPKPVPQPEPAEDRRDDTYRVGPLSAGDNETAAIRTVQEITGLGLAEAKAVVDELGTVADNVSRNVAEDLYRRAAERIRDKLTSAGAKSSIEQTGIPELEPEPVPKPEPAEDLGGSLYRVQLVCVVAENLTRTAAEKMKAKLEAVGVEVGIEEIDPQPVPKPVPQAEPAEDRRGGTYRVGPLSAGDNNTAAIRTVQEVPGLGLAEAKAVVDELGTVADDASHNAAERIQDKLPSAGAKSVVQTTSIPQPQPERPVADPQPAEPLPEPVEPPTPSERGTALVFGQILLPNQMPVEACIVRAFARDRLREQLLGETLTNYQGSYRIIYSQEQSKRVGRGIPDLVIRAYHRAGGLLGESGTRFHASVEERVDLVVSRSRPV